MHDAGKPDQSVQVAATALKTRLRVNPHFAKATAGQVVEC